MGEGGGGGMGKNIALGTVRNVKIVEADCSSLAHFNVSHLHAHTITHKLNEAPPIPLPLSFNLDLRLIGRQETAQLLDTIVDVEPSPTLN